MARFLLLTILCSAQKPYNQRGKKNDAASDRISKKISGKKA